MVLDQGSCWDKPFLLFAFPILPPHQRTGQRFKPTVRSHLSVMTMQEDEITSQADVILKALSPTWAFVCRPHPSGRNCWCGLCYFFPKTSDLVVLWKYFINLLMQSARCPLRILPCFHWLVVHQLPFIVMSIHPLSLTTNPMLGQDTRAHPRWHQVRVRLASSWLGRKVRRTASHTHIQSSTGNEETATWLLCFHHSEWYSIFKK